MVVGGAGYIGSHVCKALHEAGYTPVVYDNLTSGHKEAVRWGPLVQGDLLDSRTLEKVFYEHKPKAVIHLASFIDCRESMIEPGKYYENNVGGTLKLLEVMRRCNVKALVFSSTAAVYGTPQKMPISEDHPCQPINVYGRTKWMAEGIISDFSKAHEISFVVLRYFNAAGADSSGIIGEDHPHETHLIPLAILAGLGKKPPLQIYGDDHPTSDGTAIRDYIHVTDLALAHVKALQWLLKGGESRTLNLGSGRGYSVYEVVKMVELKLGKPVPSTMDKKKPSDPPVLVAAINQAKETLQWSPNSSDLATIVSSALKWHSKL